MYAKLKTIVTLSALGVIVPFLGVPSGWKMWLSVLLALVVGVIAYMLLSKSRSSVEGKETVSNDAPFAERRPETLGNVASSDSDSLVQSTGSEHDTHTS